MQQDQSFNKQKSRHEGNRNGFSFQFAVQANRHRTSKGSILMESTNINGGMDVPSIPAELQALDQWVLLKRTIRDGLAKTVPLSVYDKAASSTDPTTWTSFDNVLSTYDPPQHSGIGFVLTSSDDFCCINLVGCRDPETGVVADWAIKEVDRFASYTEVSPSETGLKIWIKSDTQLSKGRKKELRVPEIVAKTPAIEVYTQGHYFAMTGQIYGQRSHIESRESELQAFLKDHWRSAPEVDAPEHDWRSTDAVAVMERARKYVSRIPGAVPGRSKHALTFYVACCLVKGFSLSEDQAFELLSEWNAVCAPPMTEPELRFKIEVAAKAHGGSGYLRNAKPELWDTIEVPEHKPAKESEQVVVRSFAGIDASELALYATLEPDWLVQDIFTIDEPVLVGARSKGCKTLQLTDLAVALASGKPWMGVFYVPKRRKVLFITGEANYRRIAKHIEKACRVRGIKFADLKEFLRVEAVEFPCLPSDKDQATIRADVQQHGFEVVIVDPLYRGMATLDSARLNQMGSAIKAFQAACAPACMILSHHVVKSAAREYGEPPALEDMTGAGIAESCGQWWLVGRNEKYQWDWKHDLSVQFGGREGQGGGRRILFDEQAWKFQVEPLSEFIEEKNSEEQQKRDDARCEALERKRVSARALILKAVRNVKTPQSKTAIEGAAGAVQTAFRYVFGEMVREQTLVQRSYRDSQNRLQATGYLLAEYAAEYDKSQMLVDAG